MARLSKEQCGKSVWWNNAGIRQAELQVTQPFCDIGV